MTAERDALAAQERAAGEFASRVGPAAVRGLLRGPDGGAGRRRCRHRRPRRRRGADRPGRRDGHGPGRADRRRRRPGARGPVAGADLPAAAGGCAAARGVGHGQPGGRPARRGPAGPRRTARGEPRRRRLRADRAHQRRLRPPGRRPGRGEPRARAHRRGRDGVDAADAAAVYARLAAQLDLAGAGAGSAGPAARPTPPARSGWRGRTRRAPGGSRVRRRASSAGA